MVDKSVIYFMQSLPSFQGCRKPTSQCTVKDFGKGQSIFLRGDPASSFYIVMNVWVKIYRDTQEGDETVLALTRAPIRSARR